MIVISDEYPLWKIVLGNGRYLGDRHSRRQFIRSEVLAVLVSPASQPCIDSKGFKSAQIEFLMARTTLMYQTWIIILTLKGPQFAEDRHY